MAGKDYRTKGTYGLGGQVRIANKNSHVDYDYGAYDSFDDIPQSLYDTVQIGKTIGIVTDGKITEYWWQKQKDGTLGWVVKATDEAKVIELINKYGTQGEPIADTKELINCIAVDYILEDIGDLNDSPIQGKVYAVFAGIGEGNVIARYEGNDQWTELTNVYDGLYVICITEGAADTIEIPIFAQADTENETWIDASPDQDNIPSSEVIYVAEKYDTTGTDALSKMYLYNGDTGSFVDVTGNNNAYTDDDGTIYHKGSFTTLSTLLQSYTATATYDIVLIQSSNQIATYRFVCSSNGKMINQTLSKDQRDGTDANIRTRTGTIKTTNGVQTITWGSWTTRTPIYKEKLDTVLSSSSTNAVRNSTIKAALDNKANLNHTHNIRDIHDDDDEELAIADETDESAELVFPIESETLQAIVNGEYESEDTEMFSGVSTIRPMTSAEVQSLVQITMAAFNDAREKSE